MICPSCGENNPEGAPSCSSCGNGLEAWARTHVGRLPSAAGAVPSGQGSSEPTATAPEGLGESPGGARTRGQAPAAPAPTAQGIVTAASSGNVIAGRYKILAQLGRGGVGVVYRALDMELGEEIALKVLTISERDPAELDRVRREVKVARNITHPNVIRIYEFGTAGADAFISMQLLPGGTLAERIDGGTLKLEDAIDVSLGICEGLSAAHELGIVHRDIKPENVLFDAAGRPKVVDFGLARMANATTRTVGFSGTPFYMSPEQADGGEITVRSDVYSLGVLLFELFTGKLPFVADSLVRLAMMHVKEPPPRPKSIRPDLPDEIEEMILRALEKTPAHRYQSVADLGADLKAWRESALGPYVSPRTGDHVRAKRPTLDSVKATPKRPSADGTRTKTPILEADDEGSGTKRRPDVMPRATGVSSDTVPGVPMRSGAGDETQIRSAPRAADLQRTAPLESQSRSNKIPVAFELDEQPRKSRATLYAFGAAAGGVFLLAAGLYAGGVFEAPRPTPIPTQVARASATPAVSPTAVQTAIAVATPEETPTPVKTSTPRATPRETKVAIATPATPRPTATPVIRGPVEVSLSFVKDHGFAAFKIDGAQIGNGFFAGPWKVKLSQGRHELVLTHERTRYRASLQIENATDVQISLKGRYVSVGGARTRLVAEK